MTRLKRFLKRFRDYLCLVTPDERRSVNIGDTMRISTLLLEYMRESAHNHETIVVRVDDIGTDSDGHKVLFLSNAAWPQLNNTERGVTTKYS